MESLIKSIFLPQVTLTLGMSSYKLWSQLEAGVAGVREIRSFAQHHFPDPRSPPNGPGSPRC